MTQDNSLVISTTKLTKSYNGNPVLSSLDLKVPKHSIFGFLGPNGAGKTTTIKLMLGLISPTAGSCSVFGMDSVKDSVKIRHRVGYLAQDPRYYDYMTARETLRFTARFFYAGPKDEVEAVIDDALRLTGLEDKADRPIRGFSGGERQRLGIAQAQINSPELLILDEPAASLDPMGRRDVLELMERIRSHATIFYSTHILDDVQKVSDIVAILNHGQLKAQAPIEELLKGKNSSAYSLVLKGETGLACAAIKQLPWVSSVTTKIANGSTSVTVSVTDESKAEDQLLRTVLDSGSVKISSFGHKTYELEEIFMDIVEGKANANE